MKNRDEFLKAVFPIMSNGSTSDKSELIDRYLKEHASDVDYLDCLNNPNVLKVSEQLEERSKANVLMGIQKRLVRTKLRIALLSIVGTLLLMIVGIVFMNHYTVPVEIDGNVTIQVEDGDLYAILEGQPYHDGHLKILRDPNNGESAHDVYFFLSTSLWTKYFGNNENIQSKYILVKDFSTASQTADETINNIYYYVGDYNELDHLTREELNDRTFGAAQVWHRE